MRTTLKILAIAAMSAAAVMPAEAALYTVTVDGTMRAGAFDQYGLFGGPGGSIAGQNFQVVYTINDALAGAGQEITATSRRDFGGVVFGTPSPVSASVTINGITKNNSGGTVGRAVLLNEDAGTIDQIELIADGGDYPGRSYIFEVVFRLSSNVNEILTSLNYADATSYIVQPGDSFGSSYISIFGGDFINGAPTLTTNVFGNFDVTSVRFASAAVPEPASYALLSLGLIGLGLRRRKA